MGDFKRASQSDRHPDSLWVIIITQTLWNAVLCRKAGYFRTVGLPLKFHPSAFVVHSKGREDKQVHMYKEIIPRLRGRSLLKHPTVTLETLGFGIKGRFGPGHLCWQLERISFPSHFVFGQTNCNHAVTDSASLRCGVPYALWIRWSLRGDGPHELQRNQKFIRRIWQQRGRHCQSESAHLSPRWHRSQIRRCAAGNFVRKSQFYALRQDFHLSFTYNCPITCFSIEL